MKRTITPPRGTASTLPPVPRLSSAATLPTVPVPPPSPPNSYCIWCEKPSHECSCDGNGVDHWR